MSNKSTPKKKYNRKYYNSFTKGELINDLAPTYPYGGKFLKIGKSELLLTKTTKKDDEGNPIYIGTLVKRSGVFKNKISNASHIAVKKIKTTTSSGGMH